MSQPAEASEPQPEKLQDLKDKTAKKIDEGKLQKENQVKEEPKKEGDDDKKPDDIQHLFDMYSKFGDKNGHEGMTKKNFIKWFSQAGILRHEEKDITKEDLARVFNSFAKVDDRVKFPEFRKMIRCLANKKKTIDEELLRDLVAAGRPRICGIRDLFSYICKSCS